MFLMSKGRGLLSMSESKGVSEHSLREKCPKTEFFWSVFSSIWTRFGHFLRSDCLAAKVECFAKIVTSF